jgi:hypothetical protein
MTQACFAGAIEGRFRWQGNDVSAKEQWLDLTTFDNKWEAGTFLSEGPFTGRTTTHSWLDLAPDTVYYFRVTQQLSNGTWEASGTFQATTTPCANSGGIRLVFDRAPRETLDALAAGVPPTTPAPGRVIGFSTKPVRDLNELTPPDGTITGACNDGILYAVLQVPSAVNSGYGPLINSGEWFLNGAKTIWSQFRTFSLLNGTGGVTNGRVIRLSTYTFDVSFKPAGGVYEVRYGTGSNAVEGRVTLAC